MIGNIEVVKIVKDCAYLGWQFDSAFWNKGIKTEAAAAVRYFLFNEGALVRFMPLILLKTQARARVMQKIGMKPITAEKYCKNFGEKIKTEADGLSLSFCMIKNEVV